MHFRVTIFFLLFQTAFCGLAQKQDSVFALKSIEIKSEKVSVFSTGLHIERMDSTMLSIRQSATLGAMLSEQFPITIRSYGPGGISTLSMRGTSSTQSGVFWNGINLSQPNMGMTDLTRISGFAFSDISIQSGGAAALLGSGVMGGSLQLSNTMAFSAPVRLSLMQNATTIGGWSTALKASAGNSKLAYAGSASYEHNKNNFHYTDLYGNRKRLEHALSTSFSTIHEFKYKTGTNHSLSAGIWLQNTDREIPPTMTMITNDQKQKDMALRTHLSWLKAGSDYSFLVRLVYVDEKEYFESKSADISANYHLNTIQADAEYKQRLWKQFTLGSGISSGVIKADVTYYEGIRFQPSASLWFALSYSAINSGFKTVLNLRQDFSRGYTIPFCPSLSSELPVFKWFSLHASVSRNFRTPTLNDKYWKPGGNPDLEPEESINAEAGVVFTLKSGEFFKSKITLDFYSLLIDNMIQWIPGEAAIWSPVNVQKVWSRGIEIASRSDITFKGYSGYFRLGYNYSPSTYSQAASDDIQSEGKQLIYMPIHKIQETFYVKKNQYYAMFSYSITGKRYVQTDNSKSLAAYTLFDAYLGTNIEFRKLKIRVQAEVKNILNAQYQSVLYYPEPGRSFAFNLFITK